MAAAILALAVANSPLAPSYFAASPAISAPSACPTGSMTG
jgi:hypothetical protein